MGLAVVLPIQAGVRQHAGHDMTQTQSVSMYRRGRGSVGPGVHGLPRPGRGLAPHAFLAESCIGRTGVLVTVTAGLHACRLGQWSALGCLIDLKNACPSR